MPTIAGPPLLVYEVHAVCYSYICLGLDESPPLSAGAVTVC